MAPLIRVGIIGLSASAITSWASRAHLPYLLSPRGRARYAIVALCNSSVEAARAAIRAFDLLPENQSADPDADNAATAPGIRAYGDPADLAADPDVDLVVCCTRVDVHHRVVLPSARAGKSVFVEWPLAQDVAHAAEIVDAAATAAARSINGGGGGGARTLVGMQGRVAPPVVKLKQLLDDGRIGRVLSAEVRAFGGSHDREALAEGLRCFTELDVGGNIVTIGFGHLFDQIQHVLGDMDDIQTRLQLQRPDVKLCDPATRQVTETTRSNVPDLIIATGTLSASAAAAAAAAAAASSGAGAAQPGASVLISYRRGQPFAGSPGLVWTINGERGEIRLTAAGGPTLQSSAYTEPVTIEVHDFMSDEVETVDWAWEPWQEELPIPGRNIAQLYENFAEGRRDASTPSAEDALKRQRQIEEILAPWAATH
ncbi:oxidoreductase family protein [Purpureocillium lavendulum]|uniref:Oxidoreductase family protein n=1 Tax=Purpureocillium lavendulum TaxID=1247861 RepID=A0AB34FGG9_9HYPO|nr:oxidoreductase family protein [Purpureocillium lavendulum]